jgi:uncharacterized protein (TIGR03437 family)
MATATRVKLLCLALTSVTGAMPRSCTNNSGPCATTLTNAASFEAGPVAPGELVTLFGTGLGPQKGIQPQATLRSPYPTQVANVEVTFDGTPAPLLWVQDAQINAVAPWSLTPGQTTQVCVSYNSTSNCLSWPVVQTAPAVFTVDGTYAAAVNQDGSVNSINNPAAMGSIVTVWATGLGPVTPSQADGMLVGFPLPHNVLEVKVDGTYQLGIPFPINYNVVFEVTYAGPAPYLVAGVTQINFQAGTFPSNGMIYVTLLSSQSPPFALYIQ